MSLLTMRVLLFAAECAAASVLLPILAFAATLLFRRRAALRHLVWLTMFGVLAVLPLAALLLPSQRITLPAPAVLVAATPVPLLSEPMLEITAPMPVEMPAPAPAPLLTARNGLLLLLVLWLDGVLWHLARMTLGGIGLLRLRNRSEPFAASGAPCETRLSADISGPATFGIFRPVVLLPQAAQDWSMTRLDAVLAHEAAHVRRHDVAGQSVARLVCAFWWFNPLLWLAARALRREAELAADDAVVAGGMTPSIYAAELVALVSEMPPHRSPALSAGMADSPLLGRVQSVLATNVSRKGVTRMDMLKTASAGLALTLLLGAARIDLALAQAPERPQLVRPSVTVPNNIALKQPVKLTRQVELNLKGNRKITLDTGVRLAQAAPAVQAAPAAAPESPRAAAIAAQAAAIRLQADAIAAQARQKAESEMDPAKRAQYREEAARVAASSAELKAKADAVAAEARQRMAQANQQTMESRQRAGEAGQRALESRAKADEAGRRMGLAETDRAHIRRISSTISGVTLETQVVVPVEADLSKETQSRIDTAVSDAMSEARKKIEAAIAEAKAASPGP